MKNYGIGKKRQAGNMMIGVILAIALSATFAMFEAQRKAVEAPDIIAEKAAEDVLPLVDAMQLHSQRTGGQWPGENTNPRCSDAIQVLSNFAPSPLLAGVGLTNRFNSAYQISCTGAGGVISEIVTIQHRLNPDVAQSYVNIVPNSQLIDAANGVVATYVLRPGLEPSVVNKINRDGSTQLTAGWNVGRESITDITHVGSTRVTVDSGGGNAMDGSIRDITSGKVIDFDGLSDLTDIVAEDVTVQRIQITDVVTSGDACADTAQMARSALGAPLTCFNGEWEPTIPTIVRELNTQVFTSSLGGNFGQNYVIEANDCSVSVNNIVIGETLNFCGQGGGPGGGCWDIPAYATGSATVESEDADRYGNVPWRISLVGFNTYSEYTVSCRVGTPREV